jgi:hypothetical protein
MKEIHLWLSGVARGRDLSSWGNRTLSSSLQHPADCLFQFAKIGRFGHLGSAPQVMIFRVLSGEIFLSKGTENLYYGNEKSQDHGPHDESDQTK